MKAKNRVKELLNNSELLREIKDRVGIYGDDVIFLSGSLVEAIENQNAEGIGNRLSDIDLFIFRTKGNFENLTQYDRDDVSKKTFFFEFLDYSFDVEIYEKEKILSVLSYLENIRIDENVMLRTGLKFPKGYSLSTINTLFHRFKNSLPLVNIDEYKRIRENTPFDKFWKLYTFNLVTRIDGYRPDILGNLEEKNFDATICTLRQSFVSFLQFMIYANNDSVDREKWTITKFKNIVSRNTSLYSDIQIQIETLFYNSIRLSMNEIQTLVKETMLLMDEYIEDYSGDI